MTAKQILVVDDDPDVLATIATILQRAGYGVARATTVAEALALAGPWDLMLLDFGLPDGNGLEVAGAYLDVPAIFVSGRDGADLPKPFGAKDLRDAVYQKIGGPEK